MAKSTNVGSVSMDLNVTNGSNFDNQIQAHANNAENVFSKTISKVGKIVAVAFAADKVVEFTSLSVDAATKIQSAWTGLNSIVQGTGNSFGTAQQFITEYTQDGLVSITEAATAYKNLLARGYDTTQIEKTMTALKDSAAFGRQASYNLGEAVVSATEGLKNENSILVDNAGVTKNVAKMWKEWADAHGTTTNAMTQAQKIEAEYNGILKETKFQMGDAAAYTRTFGGQIQMLRMSASNLKVAFGQAVIPIIQLFIPAINASLVALTNFFNGINQVLKAFGISFPTVVSKASTGISNVGKMASDTASDIASTGNAAGKAAKQIKKAFGNVDEINVLNTKDTSNDTAGGVSGGGAGVDIVPSVASDSTVEDAVSGTIDKIQKFIEPLKNISFDNLINAFNNLKSSVKPIVDTIGQTLEWLYFNILVPLAKWTIEDLLPSFLNILAGAFNVLNAAIEDAKPMFGWLWENILKPIAEWTGGIIVDVLNGVGDALNWISQNEIAMSILEGLAIAIGLVSGAIAIYNGVMVVCNVVTGVFSGILAVLTSPITLVVLAIGALIAIIILLIKHWDDVKVAASKCWEGIKSVWNVVATWFNNTIIQPVKNFFVGMWDGLKNGAKSAWDGVKSVFSAVVNFFKDTFTKAWTAVKAVFSVGGKIFDGIKDGIVNAFKTVVNAIIGGINKVVSTPFEKVNSLLNKIRSISILGVEPFKGFWGYNPLPVPKIPALAQGAYFPRNNPRLAIVGDNTKEGEITTPESKIYEQTAKAIKDNNGTGIMEIHLYHHYEDGRTIIQKINKTQIEAGEVLLYT